MTYKYEITCEKGFIKIPITRKQHNKLLPYRVRPFGVNVEWYYLPDKGILEIESFHSVWAKVFLIGVMTIPAVSMNGFPETKKDIMDLIYERSRGKFSADRFFLKKDREGDKEIIEYINSNLNKLNVWRIDHERN